MFQVLYVDQKLREFNTYVIRVYERNNNTAAESECHVM